MTFDLFISYASEDKVAIARPLAQELDRRGWSVWFDEFKLTLGDNLRREIDHGLAVARFGLVILSPSYFAKEWPQRELDGLTARGLKILPIWHEVDRDYVLRHAPLLVDRLAVKSSVGITAIVREIERVIGDGSVLKEVDDGSAPAKGSELMRFAHRDVVRDVAFSPDGMRLGTASDDETARIWNVSDGAQLLSVTHSCLPWAHREMLGVVFSPCGTRFATACCDKTSRVWRLADGEELQRVAHGDWVTAVAFSAAGECFATASEDHTACVWTRGGARELQAVAHEQGLNAVTFSPNGERLATASDDRTARVWDLATRHEVMRVSHEAAVSGVAFSPNGERLATASDDKAAKVWNLMTAGELVCVTHEDAVSAVSISPDGTVLATASEDHTARVWAI